ncbi:DUF4255 domain-containing protein [Exilibacterium tricleocarpae]|uniref:DUF4255 domain-containing protein n=1 Tax=Exilibacterium tricleocarpae TaxID=2591008 RepID=A0A545TZ42_9GAMM|nr:DUF4255 domain-containing protein [Exilibacterium tricleocarpae]TQV82486.1 DUF4255 domain-containing protein [Exilibacterium tricleocarpae]
MSTPAALATVTATLQHILSDVAPGTDVTTQPPSVARSGNGPQVNIFLYGTYHNPAFSNAPMPGEARSGESAHPPLSLILKYLITAYGDNDDDISGQQLMGQAMSLLHDHPVLGRSDIEGISPDSDLHRQFERIRITPDTLTLDDMSKLWTSFQSAEYRLSTGYEVSVVLIESDRDSKTPLPVLKRGAEDRGPDVMAAPAATLSGIRFPNQKPSAELGDRVTLLGQNLSGDNTSVRFEHPQLAEAIEVSPEPGVSAAEMEVRLPALIDDPGLGARWPAGFYAVSLVIRHPDTPAWTSNSLAMPLSPQITSISPPSAPAGDVILSIECRPRLVAGQKVVLLFGDRSIEPDSSTTPADPTAPTTLVFTVENAIAGINPYVLRLRVDGADSIPVDFSGDTPAFADNQKVTIT